jgi:hypothetical protein
MSETLKNKKRLSKAEKEMIEDTTMEIQLLKAEIGIVSLSRHLHEQCAQDETYFRSQRHEHDAYHLENLRLLYTILKTLKEKEKK